MEIQHFSLTQYLVTRQDPGPAFLAVELFYESTKTNWIENFFPFLTFLQFRFLLELLGRLPQNSELSY